MEKNRHQAGLVLKYSKRRYDGGGEVEVIRSIEQQNRGAASLATKDAASMEGLAVDSEPVVVQEAAAPPSTRKSKLLQALVLGPVEICIGLVGMMTAVLAIVTFHRLKNDALKCQGQTLLTDCFQTFRKGLLDSVTTPVRVFKAATAKI